MGTSACSDDDECTLIQCISNVTVYLRVQRSQQQMRTSTVRTCRNEVCTEGHPESLPTFPGNAQKIPMAGNLTADTTLDAIDPGKSYLVAVTIPIEDHAPGATDRYSLYVLDDKGVQVGAIEETAKYQEDRPNGPNCPSTCVHAEIGTK